MRPRKRCRYCRELFDARNRVQKACLKTICQKQRRRHTQKNYRDGNRDDSDYGWDSKRVWREKYGRDFMRQYRKDHKAYVERNRRQQRERNKKRRMIVKKDVRNALRPGKLLRIRVLEKDCKERLVRVVSL